MYKRLGIRMLCVHSNSVELKVQHVLSLLCCNKHLHQDLQHRLNFVLHVTCTTLDLLEWMGAVRTRVQTADKNIAIIHTTPVHQLRSIMDYGLIFWTEEMVLNLSVLMDLFNTNTQRFTSLDVNWWTGVVWIIVMFLSAVWTLILTAPIHCRRSTGEQVI